eukprot:5312981-Pyramimonas_sp.AAC.2
MSTHWINHQRPIQPTDDDFYTISLRPCATIAVLRSYSPRALTLKGHVAPCFLVLLIWLANCGED